MQASATSKHRFERISHVSKIIAVLCGFFLILFPVGLAGLSFFWLEFLAMQGAARQMGIVAEEISLLARAAAYLAIMVQTAPLLWALWALRRLFDGYAAGAVFTTDSARYLKMVALALLSTIIVRPIGGGLFSLAMSIDTVAQPDGQGYFVLMIGSTEVLIGLAGAMVLVIAWIMGEAAALEEANATLAEENKSFV